MVEWNYTFSDEKVGFMSFWFIFNKMLFGVLGSVIMKDCQMGSCFILLCYFGLYSVCRLYI